MTQEQKELVLKDLCARLSRGVHVEVSWEYSKTDVYTSSEYYEFPNIDSLLNIFWDEKCISIRPYLRSMSSMTDAEVLEYLGMLNDIDKAGLMSQNFITKVVDWLDKKMFDHRGLIPKGLALEDSEGIYQK